MKYREFKGSKDISPQRKALYYGGMALIGIGLLLFLSGLLSTATGFGNPAAFNIGPAFMLRGIVGIILIIAGGFLRHVGARGLAGSGMVLDPQKAREDLAPYTGAIGGMARDAVEAFKANGGENAGEAEPQVMLRCRRCKALNREDAKFCDQCGGEL